MKSIIEYSFAAFIVGILFIVAGFCLTNTLEPYNVSLFKQLGCYMTTCGIGMPLVCLLFRKTGVI